MSARVFDTNGNISMTGENQPACARVTSNSAIVCSGTHAGHTIRIYADYTVYCETDNVAIDPNSLTTPSIRPGI